MFRSALFVAKNDVRRLLKKKEVLLWIFVMPALFFYFIGTMTGGQTLASVEGTPVAYVGDDTALSLELEKRLERQGFVLVDEAAIELVLAPTADKTTVARLSVDGDDPTAQFAKVKIARTVLALAAELAMAKEEGRDANAAFFADVAARPRTLTLETSAAGKRIEAPSGFEQAIPGILVMFTMLVLLTTGATTLVDERERGLLRRLASAPLRRRDVVLGKWLGKMAVGLVQIAFAMVVGTVLFDMAWGANGWMVALLLVGWAAFVAALGIVVANVARTETQASAIGFIATMVMAALGGCWWPIEVTPTWMQQLQMALPSGWAMDAIHRLVSFGEGAGAALPHLVAMTVGAAAALMLGARTFRYE